MPVEYPPTSEIIAEIEDIEKNIADEMAELKKLLEQKDSKNARIVEMDGKKIVVINDIRFKGKREDWKDVEQYLKEYVGEFYEIEESSDKVFISKDFPDEFANSESRIALKGAVAKAKANASQVVPDLIRIATNKRHSENTKEKHRFDAKYGWYRYDVRFALPVYNDKADRIERYNVFRSTMLVRHADDNEKYLYDFIAIKKEMSSPLEP